MGTRGHSFHTLQDETSIDEFFNVAATETLALSEFLEFKFLYEFDVFAPASGGEHESITRQNSFECSFTATTEISIVAPYNPRNTDGPKDIEYRVKDRIKEHGEEVQLKQSTLEETYNHRSQVKRTNDAVKDCGLGYAHARGRVHVRAQVYLALCLRLVVVITNYERGDNPGSIIITL